MSDTKKKDYELDAEVDGDFDLDDLETMPGFVTPPSGAYIVDWVAGIEEKEINGANYYEIKMTIVEPMEVAPKALDEDEVLPATGDQTSMIFNRKNKFAMSQFKETVRSIAVKFEITNIRAIMEVSVGLRMLVVFKRTFSKKRDQHTLQIVKSQVM